MPALRVFLCLVVYMAVSATKRPTGRPTVRTKALELELIDRLIAGETLMAISRDEHMPDRKSWYNWMDQDEDLFLRIQRAKDKGCDAIAENARVVARGMGESSGDTLRDKLIIETDLKLLAKWMPKKYGDRRMVENTGENGGPIRVEYTSSEDAQRALDELTRRIAVLNGSD